MHLSKEELVQKIKQALRQAGTSQMSQSPYDLGWLLRLPADRQACLSDRQGLSDLKNPKKPRYPQIISWLEKLQHSDGSWGGQIPFAHDRVISTLSVIAGLIRWPLDDKWRGRIDRAVKAVEFYSKKLLNEPEATVAFELLFPKLLREVQNAGHKINIPKKILTHYQILQAQKLSKLPIEAATKYPTTLLHALEALDENKIDLQKFEKFQSPGGSFGCSPATTAFMLLQGIGGRKAEQYLDNLVKKRTVPPVYPIDIFERAWCLLPIYLFGLENNFSRELKPHIKYLKKHWTADGVGWSVDLPVSDLDDTALVFYVLQKNKKAPALNVFKKFETDGGFVCYKGERSGSASHYIHLFLALSSCQENNNRIKQMRRKIINRLWRTQTKQGFWDDKWHISPYYATSRAVIALAGNSEAKQMVDKAVKWLLRTRHKNGLWGFGKGTAEETAYALMALRRYTKKNSAILEKILVKGLVDLRGLMKKDYPQMWMEKSLFAPKKINQIFIYSTCLLWKK